MALFNTSSIGPFPDDEHVENQRRARRLLARMERMEDHAQKSLGEAPMPEPDLPEREIADFQSLYAVTYRRLVGVEPQQRDLLRNQLAEVEQTGLRSIEEVIQQVRTSIDAQHILETSGSPFA